MYSYYYVSVKTSIPLAHATTVTDDDALHSIMIRHRRNISTNTTKFWQRPICLLIQLTSSLAVSYFVGNAHTDKEDCLRPLGSSKSSLPTAFVGSCISYNMTQPFVPFQLMNLNGRWMMTYGLDIKDRLPKFTPLIVSSSPEGFSTNTITMRKSHRDGRGFFLVSELSAQVTGNQTQLKTKIISWTTTMKSL